MFAAIATAGIALSFAVPSDAGQAAGFRRETPQVAVDGVKPASQQGRVSKESLAIAACRTRAARHGEASYREVRLAGRQTFLVTGLIAPSRDEQRRLGRGTWAFSCTVRGTGEILDFKAGPATR